MINRKGLSVFVVSMLMIFIVVAVIAVLAITIFNLTDKTENSLIKSQCRLVTSDSDSYLECIRAELGESAYASEKKLIEQSENTPSTGGELNREISSVCTGLPSGLIGCYAFENNFLDGSERGNDGIGYGTGFATIVTGNNVSVYDGINDYVQTNASKDFVNVVVQTKIIENAPIDAYVAAGSGESKTYSQMSTSFWIKDKSLVGSGTGTYNYTIIGHNGGNIADNFYIIYRLNKNPTLLNNVEFVSYKCGVAIANIPRDFSWHNIAITKGINNYKIYVDGVLKNTASCSDGGLSKTPLYIGKDSGNTFNRKGGWLNASLDYLLLFNKSLSGSEVSGIYNNQKNLFNTSTSGGGGSNQTVNDTLNKIELLFISDGSYGGNYNNFHTDVQRLSQLIFQMEPYKTRRNMFNINYYNNSQGLGCTFGCMGNSQCLTCDSAKVQRAVDRASVVPDKVIVMVNSPQMGGSGPSATAQFGTVSNGPGADYMMQHEIGGHLIGAIGDEGVRGFVAQESIDSIFVFENSFVTALDTQCYPKSPPNTNWANIVGIKDYYYGCTGWFDSFTPDSDNIIYKNVPFFNPVQQKIINNQLNTYGFMNNTVTLQDVVITSPVNGTILNNDPLNININVAPGYHNISYTQLFVDGKLFKTSHPIASLSGISYIPYWYDLGYRGYPVVFYIPNIIPITNGLYSIYAFENGWHDFKVIARDIYGNYKESQTIRVYINNTYDSSAPVFYKNYLKFVSESGTSTNVLASYNFTSGTGHIPPLTGVVYMKYLLTDNKMNLKSVRMQVNDGSYNVVKTESSVPPQLAYIFRWDTETSQNGNRIVTVTAEDFDGNIAQKNFTFVLG